MIYIASIFNSRRHQITLLYTEHESTFLTKVHIPIEDKAPLYTYMYFKINDTGKGYCWFFYIHHQSMLSFLICLSYTDKIFKLRINEMSIKWLTIYNLTFWNWFYWVVMLTSNCLYQSKIVNSTCSHFTWCNEAHLLLGITAFDMPNMNRF